MVDTHSAQTDSLLHALNKQQQAAVLNTRGPMLVLAGAGTGKTTVITRRIAHLIASGVAPHQILAVTFTKKAATEMKQRVDTSLGGKIDGLTICTFHALGYRILRENGIRTCARGNVNLISAKQQRELVADLLPHANLDSGFDVRETIREISRIKTLAALDALACEDSDLEFLVDAYQRELMQRLLVDFDDMLILPMVALRESLELRSRYQHRWRYILVDEYQDTNALQHVLVQLLVGAERNLCVVGDDDQSIYGFRGASADKMLNFRQEFPGARILKLEQNYRSKSEIVDLANTVIERSAARYSKTLRSHLGCGGRITQSRAEHADAESASIADWMQQRRQTQRWSDMAALFRVASDAQSLQQRLKDRGIPYQTSSETASNRDKITIMTLHRSKGLEFPIVFLPAVEENTLPHFHAIRSGNHGIEEERRLLYVGITRAQNELVISSSACRRGRPRTASRFLVELAMP